ncbi:MAG: carboxylate-amine ligase [Alphaproteobacteria bacterium]
MGGVGTDITIGIEEEYLLVDPETRELKAKPPKGFMDRLQDRLGPKAMHEFLQSQVEIGTEVCSTIDQARAELVELRKTVASTAEDFGMRMIAASTHPWSHWSDQEPVDMERYRLIVSENQTLARRMAICGMHIHAGIEDRDRRIELMSQASYFMPHLLALSASSPFWEGHDTGLKAFRPIIVGDLPRSGLPETFASWNDWCELLDDLEVTGMCTDASKIWWDLRPSARHPTLEIRICDICTWVEDGLTIAALYQSILAFLHSLREANQSWRHYRRILINENKWRAQRDGTEARLADLGKRVVLPLAELIDEMVELLHPFAERLGCVAELEHARVIARRGSSADHQLRIYKDALAAGADEREAQTAVVDWLIRESVQFERQGSADAPAP